MHHNYNYNLSNILQDSASHWPQYWAGWLAFKMHQKTSLKVQNSNLIMSDSLGVSKSNNYNGYLILDSCNNSLDNHCHLEHFENKNINRHFCYC